VRSAYRGVNSERGADATRCLDHQALRRSQKVLRQVGEIGEKRAAAA
jgi:hypothetical protein